MVSWSPAHRTEASYFVNVDHGWPAGADAGIAVDQKGTPEQPAALFLFDPGFWRVQDGRERVDIVWRIVQPVQSHHLDQLDASRNAHGDSGKYQAAAFVHGDESPGLRVSNCHEMLPIFLIPVSTRMDVWCHTRRPAHLEFIGLQILPSSTVEDVVVTAVLVVAV